MDTLGTKLLKPDDFFTVIWDLLKGKIQDQPIKEATIDIGPGDGYIRVRQQFPKRQVLSTNKVTLDADQLHTLTNQLGALTHIPPYTLRLTIELKVGFVPEFIIKAVPVALEKEGEK